MSEFVYKRKYINQFGNTEYECECSLCGKLCYYHRSILKKPVCFSCQKEIAKKRDNTRAELKTINRFCDWLWGTYNLEIDLNKFEIIGEYTDTVIDKKH